MASVVPGLMMALIFGVRPMASAMLDKGKIRREPHASLPEALSAIRKSVWALWLPHATMNLRGA